jgi:hypothetical protein
LSNALIKDPSSAAGRVVVQVQIAEDGSVETTEIVENSGLSPDVVACITGSVQAARFIASEGRSIRIPVSFVQGMGR